MNNLIDLVLLFFIFSFIGWCIEVFLKYREFHRFINRGFLMGPWLPIYGSGAVLITISVWALAGLESSVGTTFVISFIVCGFIEYMASYIMELRFHARWWDYSKKPMNLHGRIWIGNLILFGLGGVIIIEVANPIIYSGLDRLGLLAKEIMSGILTCLFITDYVISHFVMKLVKTGVESSKADNTEEISKEIRMLLLNRNIFYKRFADAYPEVIYRTERVKNRMEEIRQETERLRQEAEVRLAEVNRRIEEEKKQLSQSLELSGSIKNAIIENQEKLIELLYHEENATEETAELFRLIEEKKKILKDRNKL